MKWKEFIDGLKSSLLVTNKVATQQAAMTAFIPGTYEREVRHEMFRIVERVVISQTSAISEMYFVRKFMCKYTTPEEKTIYAPKADQWMSIYDSSTRQLKEIEEKRVCSFVPEESLLVLESVSYKKLSGSTSLQF